MSWGLTTLFRGHSCCTDVDCGSGARQWRTQGCARCAKCVMAHPDFWKTFFHHVRISLFLRPMQANWNRLYFFWSVHILHFISRSATAHGHVSAWPIPVNSDFPRDTTRQRGNEYSQPADSTLCVGIHFLLHRIKVWRLPPLATGVLRQCIYTYTHTHTSQHRTSNSAVFACMTLFAYIYMCRMVTVLCMICLAMKLWRK